MSELLKPVPANLTVAVMFTSEDELADIRKQLEVLYGQIDNISEVFNFSEISPYYDPEMGNGINKVIYSFEKPVERDFLVTVKINCDRIEKEFSLNGKRTVNLDPGLISLENFILSTGKNYSHRIYLGQGVYGEVTLMFGKKGEIKELPWTYRDYLYPPAKNFLLATRELYRKKRESIIKNSVLDKEG